MTSKADELLVECLQRIFTNWKALRLGVDNRAGGIKSREKAEWIPGAFLEWTVNNFDLEKFEIEEFIVDILNSEFDLLIHDGSLPTVSQQVYSAYKLHQGRNLEQLEEHCKSLPPIKPYSDVPLSSRNPEDVDMVTPHSSDESEEEEDLVETFTGQGANSNSNNKEGASTSKSKNTETVTDEDGEVWQVVKSSKKSNKKN